MLFSINAGVLVLHKNLFFSWIIEDFCKNISTEYGVINYEL